MAKFKAGNQEWVIEFDALLLDAIRSETDIDLADLSAGGLDRIATDAISLVKVLLILCDDEIKSRDMSSRDFSKIITGKSIKNARAAVLGAAECFFPQSEWSEVQSALEKRREFQKNWKEAQPLLQKLNDPSLESMRPAIMSALTEMMGDISSLGSESPTSVGGQESMPLTVASDSPESVESTQVD